MARRRQALWDGLEVAPGDEPQEPTPVPPAVRWLVVFEDVPGRGDATSWLLSWFRPGYRHCWALRETGGGVLVVQLTQRRLQVDFFPGDTESGQRQMLAKRGATFAEVVFDGDDARWSPRGLNCVGVVRALAGWCGAVQTPWGLARQLRRAEPKPEHDRGRIPQREERIERRA